MGCDQRTVIFLCSNMQKDVASAGRHLHDLHLNSDEACRHQYMAGCGSLTFGTVYDIF